MRLVNGVAVYDSIAEILAPDHTALLAVDMQNDGCLREGWWASQGRDVGPILEMIPRVRRIVDVAREAGVYVIFVEQTTLPDDASDPPAWLYFKTRDGRQRTDYTVDGSWGQQTIEQIAPRTGEPVVRKNRPSAFHLTNLDQLLHARKIESVLVLGTVTQGCVLATSLDASFHNYYTVLVQDCVQSYSQEMHELALRFLRSRYDLITAHEVIDLWSARTSGHERKTLPNA